MSEITSPQAWKETADLSELRTERNALSHAVALLSARVRRREKQLRRRHAVQRALKAAVRHVRGEASSLRDSNRTLVKEVHELRVSVVAAQNAIESNRANHAGEAEGLRAIIRDWQDRALAWAHAHEVLQERERQVSEEGWSAAHDDAHTDGSLARAAAAYALSAAGVESPDVWPASWDRQWDKRGKHAAMRKLEIAAALLLAERDRLKRQEATR